MWIICCGLCSNQISKNTYHIKTLNMEISFGSIAFIPPGIEPPLKFWRLMVALTKAILGFSLNLSPICMSHINKQQMILSSKSSMLMFTKLPALETFRRKDKAVQRDQSQTHHWTLYVAATQTVGNATTRVKSRIQSESSLRPFAGSVHTARLPSVTLAHKRMNPSEPLAI